MHQNIFPIYFITEQPIIYRFMLFAFGAIQLRNKYQIKTSRFRSYIAYLLYNIFQLQAKCFLEQNHRWQCCLGDSCFVMKTDGHRVLILCTAISFPLETFPCPASTFSWGSNSLFPQQGEEQTLARKDVSYSTRKNSAGKTLPPMPLSCCKVSPQRTLCNRDEATVLMLQAAALQHCFYSHRQ